MPFATPHARSSLSFAVSTGRSTMTPGRLQFFFSPMVAVFWHSHSTVPAASSQERTSRIRVPSAIRILLPGLTSRATLAYDNVARDVKPGNKILMADGTLILEVLSCDEAAGTVECTCLNTATIGERKNCNLPG